MSCVPSSVSLYLLHTWLDTLITFLFTSLSLFRIPLLRSLPIRIFLALPLLAPRARFFRPPYIARKLVYARCGDTMCISGLFCTFSTIWVQSLAAYFPSPHCMRVDRCFGIIREYENVASAFVCLRYIDGFFYYFEEG